MYNTDSKGRVLSSGDVVKISSLLVDEYNGCLATFMESCDGLDNARCCLVTPGALGQSSREIFYSFRWEDLTLIARAG